MSANEYSETFQPYEYYQANSPDEKVLADLGLKGWKLSQVIKDRIGERWIFYRPLIPIQVYPHIELKAAQPGEWHVGPAVVVDASGSGTGGDTNGRKHK